MRRGNDLSYQSVKKELASDKLRPAYYIRGDENFLKEDLSKEIIHQAVDERTRDFNYHPSDAGELDPTEFASLLNTPPMMYGKRLVHVKDAQRMSPRAREIATRFAGRPSPEVVLVMIDPRKFQDVSSSERSSKFLKAVSSGGGAVVTCFSLFENDLRKWVKEAFKRRGFSIDDDPTDFFVEVVGEDLMRLDREVEKITTFAAERSSILETDIEQVTGRYREDTVFELMHLTSEGRPGDAVRVLQNLKLHGEPPVRVIYWFARHYLELGRALLEPTEQMRRSYLERRGKRPRGVIRRQLCEAALHDDGSIRISLAHIYNADISIMREGARSDLVLERLVVDLSMCAGKRRKH